MRLAHPELIVDFLVPEVGRGTDRPYPVPALGIKAQPLRFLSMLLGDTMTLESHGVTVRVPRPSTFGLHKLIVSGRRATAEKKEKDRRQALEVLRACMKEGDSGQIRKQYDALPRGWRKTVLDSLKRAEAPDVLAVLTTP